MRVCVGGGVGEGAGGGMVEEWGTHFLIEAKSMTYYLDSRLNVL